MLIKIHNSYRQIAAICDSNLIGKNFEEGKRILNVKEGFFGGEEVNKEELLSKLKSLSAEDATLNIVGEKSINTALEAGIIDKKGIKKVDSIPFSLVLL